MPRYVTSREIDNGNPILNILAVCAFIPAFGLTVFKLLMLFFVSSDVTEQYLALWWFSGWNIVATSGVSLLLWMISLDTTDRETDPAEWLQIGTVSALALLVLSFVWMLIYQTFWVGWT